MGFGCPICSEKLEKLPAEGQRAGASNRGEISVSATPCGHIFHTYCIQKWLTGNLQSSKQCPCCRKPVPHLRCLSLFPTIFDESLDDSLSQETTSSGFASGTSTGTVTVPCNHGEIISSLKRQLDGVQEELREKNQLNELLTGDFEVLNEKYRREKNESDMWMMKAKQFESFRDVAENYQRRAEKAEGRVTKFNQIESMLKGVQGSVSEEMASYPSTTESIRTLVEMKHILSNDLRSARRKLTDIHNRYEQIRAEKTKLKVQFDNVTKELKELRHIYEISRLNGRIRDTSPTAGPSGLDVKTPTVFRNKRRLQEPVSTPVQAASPGVDNDIDLFPCNNVKKQKKTTKTKVSQKQSTATKKFPCGLSPIVPQPASTATSSELNDTITLSDSSVNDPECFLPSDDDDFQIRGNVPGAPLPLNRIKNLQEKSQKKVLGAGSSSRSSLMNQKKFSFKKK